MNKRCGRCAEFEPLEELFMTVQDGVIIETETYTCGHTVLRVVQSVGQYDRHLQRVLLHFEQMNRRAAPSRAA